MVEDKKDKKEKKDNDNDKDNPVKFTLRSGNSPSFKELGSTPFKLKTDLSEHAKRQSLPSTKSRFFKDGEDYNIEATIENTPKKRYTEEKKEYLKNKENKSSESILRKCVHCGMCNATCPTYAISGDELEGPRGRIYLIKDMLENKKQANIW